MGTNRSRHELQMEQGQFVGLPGAFGRLEGVPQLLDAFLVGLAWIDSAQRRHVKSVADRQSRNSTQISCGEGLA